MNATSEPRRKLVVVLTRLYHSWATRSLAVGAVATALDVLVLLASLQVFRWVGAVCGDDGPCSWHNPAAAMIGVTVGSTFTFFANRHFAFRDHTPKLAPQAVKFVVSTGAAMLLHAYLVWLLSNRLGLPVVVSKLFADILVFSVGQLLVLRYLVFPKAKPLPPQREPARAEVEEPSYGGLR